MKNKNVPTLGTILAYVFIESAKSLAIYVKSFFHATNTTNRVDEFLESNSQRTKTLIQPVNTTNKEIDEVVDFADTADKVTHEREAIVHFNREEHDANIAYSNLGVPYIPNPNLAH